MDQQLIDRLRRIRNAAALGLLGELEYSDCLAQIRDLASGKIDSPAPRKRTDSKDRSERAGKDRSE